MRGICIFIILLMASCGNPDEEPEISQEDSASQTMVSENESVDADDIVSENQVEDTVSENGSQDMAEEMEVFELSNGLYAYVRKTVYEMYLGEEGEDYARETKYDEEGNVISEIQYSEDDQYDVVNSIYTGCELFLFVFRSAYTKEEIVINRQFSYWKYVINEE